MEIFFTRFSHLSKGIFNSLDNKNLTKCQEISRSWHNYLDTQKFSQVRFIKGILEDWHEETHSWTKFKLPQCYQLAFDKANTETIIELKIAVNQFSICELRNQIRTRTRARTFARVRCACKKAFKVCVRCACVRPFFMCATCDRNFARFSHVLG